MGMLLAYELEKGTERELKSLAAALGHQVKMVSSSNYGEPLGYVAGITGFKKTKRQRHRRKNRQRNADFLRIGQ